MRHFSSRLRDMNFPTQQDKAECSRESCEGHGGKSGQLEWKRGRQSRSEKAEKRPCRRQWSTDGVHPQSNVYDGKILNYEIISQVETTDSNISWEEEGRTTRWEEQAREDANLATVMGGGLSQRPLDWHIYYDWFMSEGEFSVKQIGFWSGQCGGWQCLQRLGRPGGTGVSFGWAKIELPFMPQDNVFRLCKVTY